MSTPPSSPDPAVPGTIVNVIPPIDPCSPDGRETVFYTQPCGPSNPPLAVYCADPAHAGIYPCDYTSTVTTVVAVGRPPHLPTTGTSYVAPSISIGLVFVVLGTWLTRKVARV